MPHEQNFTQKNFPPYRLYINWYLYGGKVLSLPEFENTVLRRECTKTINKDNTTGMSDRDDALLCRNEPIVFL